MPRPALSPRRRRAATVGLIAAPLWLAVPALASATVSTSGTPAGLPPVPVPVTSLVPGAVPVTSLVPGAVPSPLASVLGGVLGSSSPTATPSTTATPNAVEQLLNSVVSVLAPPSPSAPLPTVAPSAVAGLPASLAPSGHASASGPAPLRTSAVRALTTVTSGTAKRAAGTARAASPAEPATLAPAAVPLPAQIDVASASVAAPAASPVIAAADKAYTLPLQPAAVAARNAVVAARQKRTTDQVSDGLAAAAFGCVAVAAAGQVAARRRTRS